MGVVELLNGILAVVASQTDPKFLALRAFACSTLGVQRPGFGSSELIVPCGRDRWETA